jgi:prevent-host-death family protein
MKQAKISDLKNNLSRYLDLVRQGETIQVLDRDTPIAIITSISDARELSGRDAIRQMERKGLVRKGNPDLLKPLLHSSPPGKKTGALKALLEERKESR